jgi:hypothetical protein
MIYLPVFMGKLSVEILLLILSSVVVISYIFSILYRYIKGPSMLFLLADGIILRVVAQRKIFNILPMTNEYCNSTNN